MGEGGRGGSGVKGQRSERREERGGRVLRHSFMCVHLHVSFPSPPLPSLRDCTACVPTSRPMCCTKVKGGHWLKTTCSSVWPSIPSACTVSQKPGTPLRDYSLTRACSPQHCRECTCKTTSMCTRYCRYMCTIPTSV